MAELMIGVAAPVLFWLGVFSWFMVLVGSCAAVALVCAVREWWRNRER